MLTVTNATITRSAVRVWIIIEVLWRESGSMSLTEDIECGFAMGAGGGAGCVYDAGEPIVNSPNQDWGSGSGGSMMGTAGAGGDGFLFIVVRADEVNVQ